MLIKDILVENCRVEDYTFSNLVAIRIEENIWTKLGPGGPIKILFFAMCHIMANVRIRVILKGMMQLEM